MQMSSGEVDRVAGTPTKGRATRVLAEVLRRASARQWVRGAIEAAHEALHDPLAGLPDGAIPADLERAIERDQLELHYQPVVELASGQIRGLEALARWRHPPEGLVEARRFVPSAERGGQIATLGRWALRTACHQAATWSARRVGERPMRIGVNLSGAQLREPGLAAEVEAVLRDSEFEPACLLIEITETVLMEDTAASVARLESLKELGVELAIDDFGAGHSSLRYLRRFPLDALKVDRFFVDGLGGPNEEPALVRAIVDLAEIFELRLVAEGIERPEQRARLLELGCELGQGFEISPPLPVAEADALLERDGLLAGLP